MKKRAQITLFVIAGLFILMIAALVFYMKYNAQNPNINNNIFQGRAEDTIRNYVQGCIDLTAKNAITFLGQRGFYLLSGPAEIYNVDFDPNYQVTVLYDFVNDKNYSPSKEQIESDISSFMRNEIVGVQSCVNKQYIEKVSPSAAIGNISVTTTINENSIEIAVNYPITLTKGTEQTTIDNYRYDSSVPLGEIYDKANALIASLKPYQDDSRREMAEKVVSSYYYGMQHDYIACSAEFVRDLDMDNYHVISYSFQPDERAILRSTTVLWTIGDSSKKDSFTLFFVTRHKKNI